MNRFFSLIISTAKNLAVDLSTFKFIYFCKRYLKYANRNCQNSVFVEFYPLPQSIVPFSILTDVLCEKYAAKPVSISISSQNPILYVIAYLKFFLTYRSFGCTEHINTRPYPDKAPLNFHDLYSKINSNADITKIEIDGVRIGEDIYEAYLMNEKRPTVDYQSESFKKFLKDVIGEFYYWQTQFNKFDPKSVVMSHGLYRFGIIKRIAFSRAVPVYLINPRSFFRITPEFPYGAPIFNEFPDYFASLSPEVQSLASRFSSIQLTKRMGGQVGVDMHYSTKSAYSNTGEFTKVLSESEKIKILVATHCFFDNPNAFGPNIFNDFYEWLEFLGEISNETDYEWYLKTHPDVLPGNNEVLSLILKNYPKLQLIPSSTSHHQLISEGIKFVLTVYGSIGHEHPLLGSTVINAGINPHVAYNFNYHPTTKEQYRNLLRSLENLNPPSDRQTIRDQIQEFYFVYYYYCNSDELIFKSFRELLTKLNEQEQSSSKVYDFFLKQTNEETLAITRNKIRTFVDSNSYQYFENWTPERLIRLLEQANAT